MINLNNTAAGGSIDQDLTPLVGSVKYGGGDKVRGGGILPYMKSARARNIEFQALLDDVDFTVAEALALVSGPGRGQFICTCDASEFPADANAYEAVVDVSISGETVMVAKINVKGTIA